MKHLIYRMRLWFAAGLVKVTMRLMYSHVERGIFLHVVRTVRKDVRIPVYVKDQVRHGREARKDEAVYRAGGFLPKMRDQMIIIGVELTYWLVKRTYLTRSEI